MPAQEPGERSPSLYMRFTRDEWERQRGDTPLLLSDEELEGFSGINERVTLQEAATIYLPVARLASLYVGASQSLFAATGAFLGQAAQKVPFVLGIAGSVAVGKSTAARVLQALLARWPNHRRVYLVPTDGFLLPNRVLEERGLMERKGFPESYDLACLVRFLADVKSGHPRVEVPVYSHLAHDVLLDQRVLVEQADIVILEGLNILQSGTPAGAPRSKVYVSDFIDFSIYIDADEEVIGRWYVERFLALRQTAFRSPHSYFHRYAGLSPESAREVARDIWDRINGKNLRENIMPTRDRANLILRKATDHTVESAYLRKY